MLGYLDGVLSTAEKVTVETPTLPNPMPWSPRTRPGRGRDVIDRSLQRLQAPPRASHPGAGLVVVLPAAGDAGGEGVREL